jgi:hypothetical protein
VEYWEGKLIFNFSTNFRFGSLIGGMFKVGANVNPQISNQILHSPLDKKSPYNQSGIIATPLTGGSKGSSRGMSIAISGETSIEIEKYDKFLILVSYIFI